MEIGISTASLFLRMYNEDAVKCLDKLDSRVAEVFLESFSEYREEFGKKLKENLGNLKIHSIHVVTTQYEPQLFEENDRARNDAFEMFENVLKCGYQIDAKNYTLHGKAKLKPTVVFNKFDLYIKSFNRLSEIAEKYGISVCLENVFWCFYNYVGFFSKLKDECPKLRTCLDVKQARLSGYEISDYIKEMAGRINTVHLSDYDDNGMCLPGKGKTDFEELFKRLKDAGFNGNMLIEVYKDDYKDINELSQSLEYLREKKYKIFGE